LGLSAWLIAPDIQQQMEILSGTVGNQLDQLHQGGEQAQWYGVLQTSVEKLLSTLSPVRKISDWFVDIIVIFFTSVYLAFDPKLYRRGVLALAPSHYRKKTARALDRLGETLWRWFIGRLIGMAVIGVLVALATWAAGIPLAFTLGFIAAVLEFIPYVGALVSSLPALLLASQQGWRTTWIVLVLYLVVHAIDGYIVIPLVERKAVRIPPALTIVAQLAMFMTASFLGVLVADPLVACGLVLLERFYLIRAKDRRTSQIPQGAGI
jgi:predicted PurR-regulated permease PerM